MKVILLLCICHVKKFNPSEFQILSQSPILLLNKKIALRYEIGSSVIKLGNSDGLDFLVSLFQKVQSVRKSNSVLSLLRDCFKV